MEESGYISKVSKEDFRNYFNERTYISANEYTEYIDTKLNEKLSLFYHFSL